MDRTITSEDRSSIMRSVHSKDTTPEIVVRKLIHSLGFRFRLHINDLPGKPDLVFKSQKKVIFVNGCFWHGHDCKRGARVPKTNKEYWIRKIETNRINDEKNKTRLWDSGWRILVIWECETKDRDALKNKILLFLDDKFKG